MAGRHARATAPWSAAGAPDRRHSRQEAGRRNQQMIATAVRRPLPTVAALLDLEHLGRIEGRHVERVEHEPMTTPDGLSEVPLERIVTSGPGGTRSLVLKRFAYACDLVMRATGDTQRRPVQALTS